MMVGCTTWHRHHHNHLRHIAVKMIGYIQIDLPTNSRDESDKMTCPLVLNSVILGWVSSNGSPGIAHSLWAAKKSVSRENGSPLLLYKEYTLARDQRALGYMLGIVVGTVNLCENNNRNKIHNNNQQRRRQTHNKKMLSPQTRTDRPQAHTHTPEHPSTQAQKHRGTQARTQALKHSSTQASKNTYTRTHI